MKKQFTIKNKLKITNNSGYALLLAIILTSTIISGVVALARIIVLNLHQVQYTDNAVIAAAAADSGIEKALFLLRKISEGENIDERLEDLNREESFKTGVIINISVSLSSENFFSINKNDFAVLDLPQESGINSIEISQPKVDCSQTAWIEVSRLSWNQDSGQSDVWRQPFSFNNLPAMIENIPQNVPVQLRIKALYCDIQRLYISSGTPNAPLPSRVVIKSIGRYRGSEQALQASTLLNPPLSGLFDYVLFSECALQKGGSAVDCVD